MRTGRQDERDFRVKLNEVREEKGVKYSLNPPFDVIMQIIAEDDQGFKSLMIVKEDEDDDDDDSAKRVDPTKKEDAAQIFGGRKEELVLKGKKKSN